MNTTARWWYTMPLLRILIPFVLGILSYSFHHRFLFIGASGFLVLMILIIRVPLKTQLLKKGIALSTLIFMGGYLLGHWHDIRNRSNWFNHLSPEAYLLTLKTKPVKGTYDLSMLAEVSMVKTNKGWINSCGSIRLSFPLNSTLTEAAVLITFKSPQNISDTGARKSYAQYLANQNVYHQLKLREKEYQVLEQPLVKETMVDYLQRSTLLILDRYIEEGEIRGLAKALLVGYRGELDKALNKAYISTGVVHVIAISGLHLGLIYGLLMLLFKPIQHIPLFRVISCMIVIGLLWLFTIMCGATPSVVRSAIMFSFLMVGKIIQSKPSTGNMLAASALVMLALDPFLIYDIGFQLSYAAVSSLLIYNHAFSSIWEPKNGFLQLGWSSISTSLSAQVLTTPFVLYHFHQFPLIFILSNIIAIPLSSIALLLLILVCLCSKLPLLAQMLAVAANGSMWLMNDRILALASLPFSTWEELPFNAADLLFSLLSIGMITIYFKGKHPLALKAFLLTLLIWSILYHYSS